jgi:hypothetical protein
MPPDYGYGSELGLDVTQDLRQRSVAEMRASHAFSHEPIKRAPPALRVRRADRTVRQLCGPSLPEVRAVRLRRLCRRVRDGQLMR